MNSFGVLQALIFEPRKAFAEIAERPRVLFPLLLLIVCTAGLTGWYTGVVDLEWLTDQQLRNSGFARMMSEAQIEQSVSRAGEHPGTSIVTAVLGATVVILILRLLESLYYLLAGKMTGIDRSYRQWMSLACWTSLPSLLAVIPAVIILATATSAQIDQAALQPLSLNNLFFHRVPADAGYTLLNSVNLLQIVGSFLAAAGIRAWSGRSWLHGLVTAFLPMVVFFGGWALIAMGRQ